MLELAESGRVGAKSVSDDNDYLAVLELLQRAESGYEAVQPVISRVLPGLFPLSSTDLANEYLKLDNMRLPAQDEYIWMSNFGAHMAALLVALDELLPYVHAANQDFTPYLARARNHAEAIDTAFSLSSSLPLMWSNRLHDAGVDVGVAAVAGVAAKTSWDSGPSTYSDSNSLTAQTLKSYAGGLSQFAEFCHDCNSPLEATIATPVRYVAWTGGWATKSDVVLDYIDPNGLPSPGACFFFSHIAPLRHFQFQQDSVAVVFRPWYHTGSPGAR
eukprot:jgi/Tetstr1/460816/TSEL_000570.t1